ncbi:MFS transporter [Granulicella cerasi]|uniref:MFS transporter n=1 Tax=Granulicella cerasi TaxID=741063 RepID=A0ABW1Z696_9BACT|nr:MFS transporter [Granulicella cerasi]
MPDEIITNAPGLSREALLRVLSSAAFLVFFQSYLIAPLVPTLAAEFHAPVDVVGLLVPAYLLPYGLSTLFYGPLSDRLGRKPVVLCLLAITVVTTAGVGTAHSIHALLLWRVLGGLATGGVIPIGLALLGDIFPYRERGRPIGWMFGAMAGGMAFGSTLGALLNPLIGWRAEFFITALLAMITLAFAYRFRGSMESPASPHRLHPAEIAKGYFELFRNPRAARGYAFIFFNGLFHSGIFSWLGLYFYQRYRLGDVGIGLALIGYGLPGMLLGPMIGKLADRIGRRRLIPAGILVAAACSALLIPKFPVLVAALAITVLSLGYDMSHPLLAGIITSVNPNRRGLAMGMNAFVLFSGFGSGTLLFSVLMKHGMNVALLAFTCFEALIGVAAVRLFSEEKSTEAR